MFEHCASSLLLLEAIIKSTGRLDTEGHGEIMGLEI